MLRLRFGEPVRLKFLVGMLNSYNSSAFHISCLKFLNKFLETSKDSREKILIQTELEEAGFDPAPLRKMYNNEHLQEELQRWQNNYVDVNSLVKKLLEAERANRKLREEVSLLKDKFRHSEEDRKRSKATLERLRYELFVLFGPFWALFGSSLVHFVWYTFASGSCLFFFVDQFLAFFGSIFLV